MFYLFKTPHLVQKFFSSYLWKKDTLQKSIYLTFDDGPTPEVTVWILKTLKEYKAKASFFCIGKNIEANPNLMENIQKEGHTIGNHTYSHLNGWKTSFKSYTADVLKAKQRLNEYIGIEKELFFRPAYGKITKKQANRLQKEGYTIVMWDVLSGDFDTNLAPDKSLQIVLKHLKPGSILVFHDSVKAKETLEFVLPKTLAFCKKEGYDFLAL